MQNIEMKTAKNILTITVDLLKELGTSASGKSTNIATTGGNVEVPGFPEIKIGLNVYKKKEA